MGARGTLPKPRKGHVRNALVRTAGHTQRQGSLEAQRARSSVLARDCRRSADTDGAAVERVVATGAAHGGVTALAATVAAFA